jgi:hypothetical protein
LRQKESAPGKGALEPKGLIDSMVAHLAPSPRRIPTLQAARVELFRRYVAEAGGQLTIDGEAYRRLRFVVGMTRASVDRAIDQLLDNDQAELYVNSNGLTLALVRGAGQ